MTSDDRDLLKRIAEGDNGAFSAFYRANLSWVLAYFRQRVATPDLAFDLAAETFAAVITSADSYSGEGTPSAWLQGIARNKLRDSFRRGRVEDEARQRLGMEPIALDDRDLERVEERASVGAEALERELDSLPDPIRRAVVARVVDERDYSDIAAELECSEQLVRQRVRRGLGRLRAVLKEEL